MKRYKNGSGVISGDEYLALAELRYQVRRFLRFSEDAARRAGVEPQQHQLLLVLKRLALLHVRPAIGVLAERLQVQHHSAVELVDRSVQRKLARRVRYKEDRRQVLVELTPKGERLLRDLTLHHRDALNTAVPALRDALNVLMPNGEGPNERIQKTVNPRPSRPRSMPLKGK